MEEILKNTGKQNEGTQNNSRRNIRKQIVGIALALVMALTMGVAFADEGSAKTNGTKSDKQTVSQTVQVKNPIQVRAKAKGNGHIIVKWTKKKRSHGYKVYRAKSENGKYKLVFKTKKASRCYFKDNRKKLKVGKTYFYKVSPNNAASLIESKTVSKGLEAQEYSTRGADSNKAKVKNVLKFRKKMKLKATAYSGGGLCANGKRCKVGRVAVDPRVIKLGTWMYIEGYGYAQACDTGGAIKGKRIDLYYNSEGKCNAFGRRTVKAYILK